MHRPKAHQVDTRVAVVILKTARMKQAVQIMPKPCTGPKNHSHRAKTKPDSDA